MCRNAHAHTEAEWELWPRSHELVQQPTLPYARLHFKTGADHKCQGWFVLLTCWSRMGLGWPHSSPLAVHAKPSQLSHRVRASGLLAPVPFGAHLCQVGAPWRWSLLSFLDCQVVGNWHFVSLMFVSSQCLSPHNGSTMSNEWMNEGMNFLQRLPWEWHGKSSLGSEHIHILD